jgi:hypothetical protein
MPEEKPAAKRGEYQGNPIITIYINNNENFRFSFGYSKAKAILAYLDEIKEFVDEMEKTKGENA